MAGLTVCSVEQWYRMFGLLISKYLDEMNEKHISDGLTYQDKVTI